MLPSLLVFTLFPSQIQAESCIADEPTVLEQVAFNPQLGVEFALTASCGGGFGGHWAAPDSTTNASFTLDYGAEYKADGFHLRNDHNQGLSDR